jgi:translocator protein|tara:strand:+ start:1497 stop:1922 length:426 start_codon:yes stop_codon:yes gene_type:complete
MNQIDLLRLFYPMVAGYGVSKFCKMGKSGVNIKFRPPPYVFGIVWPILYILLGLSWINSNPSQNKMIELLYITLSTLLAYWIVVYACQKNKKQAVYVMLAIILCIVLLMIQIPKRSQLYLAPLGVWLLYALLLSTTELQFS